MKNTRRVASSFADLVACGKGKGHLTAPLQNMKGHVYNLSREAINLLSGPPTRKATFSPYIGRAILEAGLTAILFRSDPFRAITLTRFQTDGNFDHNTSNNISISWQKDIICHEDIKHPWKASTQPEAVSRALLSPYTDEVIWQPAFNEAADHLQQKHSEIAYPMLLNHDGEKIIGIAKGQIRQLYSFWSKGVHGEFFAMGGSVLDSITCDEKLKRSIDVVLDLAYVSHFIHTSPSRFSASSAAARYLEVKEFIHA